MKCDQCQKTLKESDFVSGYAFKFEGAVYCEDCSDDTFRALPDAPLVDMNENFDTEAVSMVENMDLDDLNASDTGYAAIPVDSETDTHTVTVSLDDLDDLEEDDK